MHPKIEFAKSTVDLNNLLGIRNYNYESYTYNIFHKDDIQTTDDAEFISSKLGWPYYDREVNDPVEYISYWNGNNMMYIEMDGVYHNADSLGFLQQETIEIVSIDADPDPYFPEYAIIKVYPQGYPDGYDSYYLITGTSNLSHDVLATITYIGNREKYESYSKEEILQLV